MEKDHINGYEVHYRFSCEEKQPRLDDFLMEAEAFRESHFSRVQTMPTVVHFISVQVLQPKHRLAVGNHKEPAHLRWMADVRFYKEGSPPCLDGLGVLRTSGDNKGGLCTGPFDEKDWIYLAPFLRYIERITRTILLEHGHGHTCPHELWATNRNCHSNFFFEGKEVATKHLKDNRWQLETKILPNEWQVQVWVKDLAK
jgi:hypothetical protein